MEKVEQKSCEMNFSRRDEVFVATLIALRHDSCHQNMA
jgi:hypothetical protein